MKSWFLPLKEAGQKGLYVLRARVLVFLALAAFLFCFKSAVPGAKGASDFAPLPKESGVALTNAVILVSPKVLDFGSIAAGKSVTNTFLVENVGGGKLVGTASVSAPFRIISGGEYALKEKQVQVVTVAYAPGATGAITAKVTFTGGGGAKATVTGKAVSARE